jgi:hypothetical protein
MPRFKNLEHMEAYVQAIYRNKTIKQWIKDNKFSSLDEVYSRMKDEKPEWYEELEKSFPSRLMIERYFTDRQYEEYLVKSRAIARNGEPNTREAKPVICLETGTEFKSINTAARWLNHKRTHDISDCCYGIIDNVKGYHFKFKED